MTTEWVEAGKKGHSITRQFRLAAIFFRQLRHDGFDDGQHHGRRGGVADPHRQEHRGQHEAEHQPGEEERRTLLGEQ